MSNNTEKKSNIVMKGLAALLAGGYSIIRVGLASFAAGMSGLANGLRNGFGYVFAWCASGFSTTKGAVYGLGSVAVDKTKQLLQTLFALGKELINLGRIAISGVISGGSGLIINPLWNYLIAPLTSLVYTVFAGAVSFSFNFMRNILGYALSTSTFIIGRIIAFSMALEFGIAVFIRHFTGVVAGIAIEVLNGLRKVLGLVITILDGLRYSIQNFFISPIVVPILSTLYHLVKALAFGVLDLIQSLRMLLAAVTAAFSVFLYQIASFLFFVSKGFRKLVAGIGAGLTFLGVCFLRAVGLVLGFVLSFVHFVGARILSAGLVFLNAFRQGLALVFAGLIWSLNALRTLVALVVAPFIGLLTGIINSLTFIIVTTLKIVVGFVAAFVAEFSNFLLECFAIFASRLTSLLAYLCNLVIAPLAGVINAIAHARKYIIGLVLDVLQIAAGVISLAYISLKIGFAVVAEAFTLAIKGLVLIIGFLWSLVYGFAAGGIPGLTRFLTSTWEKIYQREFAEGFNYVIRPSEIGPQLQSVFESLVGNNPCSQLLAAHAQIDFSNAYHNGNSLLSIDNVDGLRANTYHSIASSYRAGELFTPVYQGFGGSFDAINNSYNQLSILDAITKTTKNSISSIAGVTFNKELFDNVYESFGGTIDYSILWNNTLNALSFDRPLHEKVYDAFNLSQDLSSLTTQTFQSLGGQDLNDSWQDFTKTFQMDEIKRIFNIVYEPTASPDKFGYWTQKLSWQNFITETQNASNYVYDNKSFAQTLDDTFNSVGGTNDCGSLWKNTYNSIGGTTTPIGAFNTCHQTLATSFDALATGFKENIAGTQSFWDQIKTTDNLLNPRGIRGFYNQLSIQQNSLETMSSTFDTLKGDAPIGSYWNALPEGNSVGPVFWHAFDTNGGAESEELFNKINYSSMFGKEFYSQQSIVEPVFDGLLDNKTPQQFATDSYASILEGIEFACSSVLTGILTPVALIYNLYYFFVGPSYGLTDSGLPGLLMGIFQGLYSYLTFPFRCLKSYRDLRNEPGFEKISLWDFVSILRNQDISHLKDTTFNAWSVLDASHINAYDSVVDGNPNSSHQAISNALAANPISSSPKSSPVPGYGNIFQNEVPQNHPSSALQPGA